MSKNIVISGASRGIGVGLAKYYLSKGDNVAVISLASDALVELASTNSNLSVFVCSVSDRKEMFNVCQKIIDRFGNVDLVIANAGLGGLNPGDDFSYDIHDQFVDVNFNGTVNTLMPFVPNMIKQRRGHLVAISSLAAFRGLPNAASYSSTKAAQKIFVESMRVDLKKHNIAVSSIHPGFVKTKMAEHSEFDMPFMISVDQAVENIVSAIESKKAFLLFPWPMKLLTLVNVHLPAFIYDWLLPKLSGSKKRVAKIF